MELEGGGYLSSISLVGDGSETVRILDIKEPSVGRQVASASSSIFQVEIQVIEE